MLATDFSKASKRALDQALALSEKYRARLTVLHVIDVNAPATVGAAGELMRSLWAKEAIEMARVRLRLRGRVSAQTEVQEGLPSEVIVERSRDFDLVVMGAKPAGGRWNFFSRHTVQSVAKEAVCPVMVVEEDDLRGEQDSLLGTVQKG